MKTLKLRQMDTRHKLSEVSEYFTITTEDLVEIIQNAADAGMLFQHDVKRLGNDYLLSDFALTNAVLDYDDSLPTFERLVEFLKPLKGSAQKNCLPHLLISHENLALKIRFLNRYISERLNDVKEYITL